MTFWQGLAMSLLANATTMGGAASDGGGGDNTANSPEQWGKRAQNFLICVEMLLFSIAHFYCFPTEEWEEGYQPVTQVEADSAFGDFMSDLRLIMR